MYLLPATDFFRSLRAPEDHDRVIASLCVASSTIPFCSTFATFLPTEVVPVGMKSGLARGHADASNMGYDRRLRERVVLRLLLNIV